MFNFCLKFLIFVQNFGFFPFFSELYFLIRQKVLNSACNHSEIEITKIWFNFDSGQIVWIKENFYVRY